MSATDPHEMPPGLLAGLGDAVLAAIAPFRHQPMLGLPDAAKPAVIAALASRHDSAVLVLAATASTAANLLEALPLWLDPTQQERVSAFPARESAPYDRQRPAPDLIEARLTAL